MQASRPSRSCSRALLWSKGVNPVAYDGGLDEVGDLHAQRSHKIHNSIVLVDARSRESAWYLEIREPHTQFKFKAEASQNSNSMTSFPVLKRRMETGSWPYWHSAVAVHHNQASTSRTPHHHIMHIYCSDCLCLTREYTVARYWRHTRSIRSRLCPRWPCKWHKCRDRVPKHLHHDARSGNCP